MNNQTEADITRIAKSLCEEWDKTFDHEDPESFDRLALAAVRAAGISEWNKISDTPVPEDGTWFMICNEDDGYESYEVGKYEPLNSPQYELVDFTMESPVVLYRKIDKIIFKWRGFNNMQRATHWRLAPEPPK